MTKIELTVSNDLDDDGNPNGGEVMGLGMNIRFQRGVVQNGEMNGTTVEAVLTAALQRLIFLNGASDGRFACRQNSLAITKIQEALFWLNDRTTERRARGVEGTHQP